MLRPLEESDSWTNLFVIHQNRFVSVFFLRSRVKHGETSYIPEHFLPGFLDLVIWGHEHEYDFRTVEVTSVGVILCPNKMLKVDFLLLNLDLLSQHRWLQVKLSKSTLKRLPAHGHRKVALLQVRNKEFKLEAIPLRTVRPFMVDEVVLQDHLGQEKCTLEHVEKFLRRKVLGCSPSKFRSTGCSRELRTNMLTKIPIKIHRKTSPSH